MSTLAMHRVVRARPVRAWWRDTAGLTAWLSVLFVVALWVSGRGPQDLGTDFLTSTGRLIGLLSADLLLLQLLLMARIPWVERSYGDAIVRSLGANRGNKERAAADLGMSRATIYRKIRAFGIVPDHT
jgi:hypothetical protein